jgi:hypothetical protein
MMTDRNMADLLEARAHLRVALAQALPSDDAILVEHMRMARELLDQVLEAARCN